VRKIKIEKRAQKFLKRLPRKQARQARGKISSLLEHPSPPDSKLLKGYVYRSMDVGEYRVIYKADEETVTILLVGKRNDSDVYRRLDRLGL